MRLLFGLRLKDLKAARTLVEGALGLPLAEHESAYRAGEYYRFNGPGLEEVILQHNWDAIQNEWCEDEAAGYPLVLSISGSDRASLFEHLLTTRIPEIKLVARTVV